MADYCISFQEFCETCEKIQSNTKFANKEQILSDFILKYKKLDETKSTFYPALRLLVPEYERERSPYGLKETNLSRLYVRTLCLRGTDADQLQKYNKVSSKNNLDFADVAYWVLRKWCPNSSSLTLADVNNHLDKMAQRHADHQPREVENELSKMIKISTAVEQKWIIRIILKNMRLGLGNDRILKVFHPDAPDLFDVSSSLSKICSTLIDSTVRLHELEVEIFTPFRPMLSLQCDSKVLNQIFDGDKYFYVENKYDGERFQMHMKDGVFKYFSKNGYDYSNIYGEEYNSSGLITPHLQNCFSNTNSVILDGEMMGWNTKTKNFGSKGMSYDVKKLTNDSIHRPCFCVFDILLINGTILTNQPLIKRLEILDNLFEPIKGVILKSPRLKVKTKQEMMEELNKSVDRKEEGICFKDPQSIYKPNNRKSGWWKMKLEYFSGLMTELDLIVIGGYYGEGKRSGLISSFLLGVANCKKDGESPKEFYTFAKVANGFTVDELDKLLFKLNPHWKSFEENKNPDGIVWKKEKPDCWIDPRKSCVLQVKASELVRSTDFQTEYTLRFPRVEKIRYDKPWYNCYTLNELKELTKNNKAVEKLTGRHITEDDIEITTKRSRKSNDLIHLLNVEQKSTVLTGKEFCVLSGNEQFSKEDIEVRIKEHGGKVVQFAGPKTMCTLVGNITPRVNTIISLATVDIVKLDWILKVFDNSVLIKFTPDDMIKTTNKTELIFSDSFDKYGDSYFQLSTRKSLENVMANIKKQENKLQLKPLKPRDYTSFDEEISFINPLGLFRQCSAYFDKYLIVNDPLSPTDSILKQFEYDFEFFGGIKQDKLENITHVIVHLSDQTRVELIKKTLKDGKIENIKIVNENWIKKSLESGMLLFEDLFCL